MRAIRTRLGLFMVAVLAALSFSVVACAQGAVQQSGAVTPFHAVSWFGNGVVGDGGGFSSPTLSGVSMFNGANCPWAVSSQTGPGASTAPYGQFSVCQTLTTTTLNVQGVNGAATPTFQVNIGGTIYPFPGPGTGNVIGPATSVVNDFACFNNTHGTLLSDCGTGASYLQAANNLSDVASASVSRSNLFIGGSTTLGSGSTVNLASASTTKVTISGTTTINSFGTAAAGVTKDLTFTSALVLTYNGTSMILPNNGVSLGIQAGDQLRATSLGSGNWVVTNYSPAQVWSFTQNPANNTPYLPYNFTMGAGAGTSYPDFGFMGAYSAPHLQTPSLILGGITTGTNIWAWGDNGSRSAPTGWGSTPLTQLQILIWGLDNTNQRTPSQAVAPGQSAFQGRQAEVHLNMYGSQTQTSRPGAIELLTGRSTWQVPTATAWLDQNGGMVFQGQAINSAVTHGTLTYPWQTSYDYAPIPNLNWYTYLTDANVTLIASDEADAALLSMYRWDKIANGTGHQGFRWNYNFAGDLLRLQAIPSGNHVIDFDLNGNVFPANQLLMGVTAPGIGSDTSPLQIARATSDFAFSRTTNGTVGTFYQTATAVGSISVTGTTTTYATSSDRRLKTHLRKLSSKAFFDRVNVYLFDWVRGGSGMGVVAQELYDLLKAQGYPTDAVTIGSAPEVKPTDKGFVPWQVDYSKLVPLIMAETLSLRERVRTLENGHARARRTLSARSPKASPSPPSNSIALRHQQ